MVVEVDSTFAAIELADWLRHEVLDDVVDLVPAARTVLVQCATVAARRALERRVHSFVPAGRPDSGADIVGTGVEVVIEVVYDGDDLEDVGRQLGLDIAGVIAMHTQARYSAAFCGFVPGFTYLTAPGPLLDLPRRATPRTRVPAGSVAVAAGFAGIYPTASPGGWNLLGRTAAVLWDPGRARPALVEPGDTVRFVAVGR